MLSNGYLASCSWDKSIKLWDITKGSCIRTLNGHSSYVNAIIEAPNSILISGSWDKTVRLWDLNDNGPNYLPLKTIEDKTQLGVAFHALCLINDDVFAVGSNIDINIYKIVQSLQVVFQRRLTGHSDTVFTMQATKNKEVLISVSRDTTCKTWNIHTGQLLRTFDSHKYKVYGLVVISDNVVASSSKEIKVWDIKSGKTIKTIDQHDKLICHMAISQDERLFTCGEDTKVHIYKI